MQPPISPSRRAASQVLALLLLALPRVQVGQLVKAEGFRGDFPLAANYDSRTPADRLIRYVGLGLGLPPPPPPPSAPSYAADEPLSCDLLVGLSHTPASLAALERSFWSVADPQSSEYRGHWSRGALASALLATDGAQSDAMAWFSSIGASVAD